MGVIHWIGRMITGRRSATNERDLSALKDEAYLLRRRVDATVQDHGAAVRVLRDKLRRERIQADKFIHTAEEALEIMRQARHD